MNHIRPGPCKGGVAFASPLTQCRARRFATPWTMGPLREQAGGRRVLRTTLSLATMVLMPLVRTCVALCTQQWLPDSTWAMVKQLYRWRAACLMEGGN